MIYKVVFFGKSDSGKTQLNNRIANLNFEDGAPLTIGADFLTRRIDSNNSVSIWDTAGREKYKGMSKMFYRGADVGVFCIDLTQEIKEEEILKSIQEFRHYVPTAPIICVGTKSDSPKADVKALDRIKSKELFADFIITSAKDDKNVENLFGLICKYCSAKLLSLWNENVEALQISLQSLPSEKSLLINKELIELSQVILARPDNSNVSPKIKVKAIEDFKHNCKAILKDEYPDVLKAVLSVAAAAIVLTVTALIGFTIGVACSWWTGPGAFFAGLLSGYTAAVTVASSSTMLGALTGGLTAYGLFKSSPELRAINEFAETVSSFDPAIVL
ncbi:Rab family GTPase [Legionella sp. PC997]|uniref:Rab family GTPase n=1 Tax=Legionella sp. PC997 TaxID=2755562 RepID=UPI0015FC588B|nr:Rab family GTPase [Legionella sp. PC997]QMT60376.1 hypothetical protein HBNCFIEN_01748 [Legionella sp. PC997]